MGYRRKIRELALGYLYQQDCKIETLTEDPEKFFAHFADVQNQREFFFKIVEGVTTHLEKLDQDISAVAEHWKLSRMARVDRVILRIASWELLEEPDTPHRVVIDEAVEIARKFSTEESASFVNGLLDHLARKYRKTETEA